MCEQVTVEVRKKSAFQARRFYWIRNHPRGPLEISVPKEKCSNGPSFSFWRGKRGKVPDILWLWFCQVLHHMRASSHFHMHLKNVHLQTELKPLGMVESSGALSSNTWIGWRVSRWGSHPWWFRLHNGLLRQARLFEADSDSLSSFMKSSCSYSHHFLRTYLGARNCFRGFPCLLSPLSSGPYGKVSLASSSVQSLKTRVRLFASTWTAAARPPCSSPTPGNFAVTQIISVWSRIPLTWRKVKSLVRQWCWAPVRLHKFSSSPVFGLYSGLKIFAPGLVNFLLCYFRLLNW